MTQTKDRPGDRKLEGRYEVGRIMKVPFQNEVVPKVLNERNKLLMTTDR